MSTPPPVSPEGWRAAKISDWILLKSNQFLAFNKPAGLAVQSAKTQDPDLQQLASAYAKRDLYLLHRIDQPVSGLVLFARHKSSMSALQEQIGSRSIERSYLALTEGKPEGEEGWLEHYLLRDGRSNKSRIVDAETAGAKASRAHWRLIGKTDRYFLLQINLDSGRHHQIRAQLAAAGAPVHGDVKYGARRANKDRSIHLHSWQLRFTNPSNEERIELEAPLPTEDALWKVAAGMLGQ